VPRAVARVLPLRDGPVELNPRNFVHVLKHFMEPASSAVTWEQTTNDDRKGMRGQRTRMRAASRLTTDQELRDWLLDIARQWMDAAKQQRIAHAVDLVPPKRAA
jgi:hypothetical protein